MLANLKNRTSSPLPATNVGTDGIRDIVIPLVTAANSKSTNEYALSLAEMFDASVTAMAYAFDPIIPVTGPFDSVPATLIEELLAKSEQEARQNAANFETQAEGRKLKVSANIVRTVQSDAAHAFAQTARSFDLAILPQDKHGEPSHPHFAEPVLFQSGRPAIVVPYIHHAKASLKRVMVCWDGSRAAARAISDAWPLLAKAETVDIVTAGREDTVHKLQEQLAGHFAQHNINAQRQMLAINNIDIGNAILSHAADTSATLLVMGGYGHSRAREWILGGVSRTILRTMTLPVLLSH